MIDWPQVPRYSGNRPRWPHGISVLVISAAALPAGCANTPPRPLKPSALLEASCPSPLLLESADRSGRTDHQAQALRDALWRNAYAQCRDAALGIQLRGQGQGRAP